MSEVRKALELIELGQVIGETKGIQFVQNFRENGSRPFCWDTNPLEPKGGTPCFP